MGGHTYVTEFNLLTGIDLRRLSGFYQTNPYALLNFFDESLPLFFRKQNYENSFLTTYDGNSTGGGEFFIKYGFDRMYDEKYFYKNLHRQNRDSDSMLFKKTVELLKENQNTPKFIFLETMQNHGPYGLSENVKSFIKHENKEIENQFNDYLTRLEEIDKDFKILSDYVEKAPKDTILIYFGDHQPTFGETLVFKDNITNYHTFYAIKANFPIDISQCSKDLDIMLMPGLILDLIGNNSHEHYQVNSVLRNKTEGKFELEHELCASYSDYLQNILAEKFNNANLCSN